MIPGRADPVPVTLLTGLPGRRQDDAAQPDPQRRSRAPGRRSWSTTSAPINIDAELIEGVEENTINLANGCICCEIRDDLVLSLEELLTRADAIDYVILEASGVADPEGVVMTFLDKRYERLLRLDSITCIVDAEAVFAHGDNQPLTALKMRQIGFADLVVLNKIDLVGPVHVEVIKEWVGHHLNRVRMVETIRCEVPLEVLLAVGRFDPANVVAREDLRPRGHRHEAVGNTFDTWSYESDRPFSHEALRELVRRKLPASIYRCKGIVHTADRPGKRLALQAVGRRTELTELDDWGERTPRSRIVAIGSSMDAQELGTMFDACLAPSK